MGRAGSDWIAQDKFFSSANLVCIMKSTGQHDVVLLDSDTQEIRSCMKNDSGQETP